MKKQKKKLTIDFKRIVQQSLRTDFFFTEEDIELIDQAIAHRSAPRDVVERMSNIADGKVSLPERPKFVIDYGDGTSSGVLQFTNHPINLLLDYLLEKYGHAFGNIYWSALTSQTYRDFHEYLCLYKKSGMFINEDKAALEKRKMEHSSGGVA